MEKKIISQKIVPNLWFKGNAQEAVDYYLTIFKNSRKLRSTFYGKEGFEFHQMPAGTLLTQEFELEGQKFVALNGGDNFTFNEAISFIVNCENQEEIDYYWNHLTKNANEKDQVCGWLKDQFGVSWQIVPSVLTEMLQNPDENRTGKVMSELFKMKKINISILKNAYEI